MALAGCATNTSAPSTENADALTVKGQLAYRERIALPPDSQARITVIDSSIADRKAPVVASRTIELANRQVPVSFAFDVPRADLRPRRRYSLRATITGPDNELLWTTDTAHRVDTGKGVNDFGMLILKRAQADTDSHAPLTGTEWVVEDIASGGIIDYSRVTLNFDADGRIHGRTGCNSYSGEYTQTGDQLRIGANTAATMMACAPALNKQERRFLNVLQDARGYNIDPTGKLIIRSHSGQTLEAYPAG